MAKVINHIGERVLICGSRDWADVYPIYCVLNGYQSDGFPVTVIQGGARGADQIAARWAELNNQPCETYPADWTQHGKAAGPIRNGRMLAESKPTAVWAFVTKPLGQSRGTADMVQRVRATNVPCYVVKAEQGTATLLRTK